MSEPTNLVCDLHGSVWTDRSLPWCDVRLRSLRSIEALTGVPPNFDREPPDPDSPWDCRPLVPEIGDTE